MPVERQSDAEFAAASADRRERAEGWRLLRAAGFDGTAIRESVSSAVPPSSLGSATLLQFLRVDAPEGSSAEASPATLHAYQATLYPTCGLGSITPRHPAAGRPFRQAWRTFGGGTAIDPETGEIVTRRLYQWEDSVLRQMQRGNDARLEAQVEAQLIPELGQLALDLNGYRVAGEAKLRADAERVIAARDAERDRWRAERQRISEQSACRRAANKARRYARHNRLDHLVTLTYQGDGVRTWDEIVYDWRIFLQSFQREWGHHAILGVVEPHPEGHGYHIHFGIRGKLDTSKTGALRRCWQKGYGYGIDVAYFGTAKYSRGKGAGPKRVAQYLTKYIVKGLGAEALAVAGIVEGRRPGQHRYFVAEGVQPPCTRYYAWDRGVLREVLRVQMNGEPWEVWVSDEAREWYGPRVECFDWWPSEHERRKRAEKHVAVGA